MDTDTQTEPEPQQQRETGWREHPDFPSLSDAELAAEEAIISDRIKWAVEDADEERWGWYRDQLRLLNAERARRNEEVNSYNSFNSYAVADKKPVLDPEALHGLAGEIVKAIDPYTAVLVILSAISGIDSWQRSRKSQGHPDSTFLPVEITRVNIYHQH